MTSSGCTIRKMFQRVRMQGFITDIKRYYGKDMHSNSASAIRIHSGIVNAKPQCHHD